MRYTHPAVIRAAAIVATALLANALHACPITIAPTVPATPVTPEVASWTVAHTSTENTPDITPGGTVTITDTITGTVTESNITIVHTAAGLDKLLDNVQAAPTIGNRYTLPERTGVWQFIGSGPKGYRFNQVSKDGTRLLAGKTCSITDDIFRNAVLSSPAAAPAMAS